MVGKGLKDIQLKREDLGVMPPSLPPHLSIQRMWHRLSSLLI